MRAFNDMPSKERYVLVTGAYGGMGRAVTAALRERGYFVLALDKRVEAPCDGVFPIQADITTEEGVCAAYHAVKLHTPSLCAVLHFAGIYT